MVSRFLDPTNHAGAVRDVKHPPELLRQGKVRGQVIRATRINPRADFVTNAPPVIREGPSRTQEVRSEYEVERNRDAYGVCHRYWISDFWCLVDFCCHVEHGSEDNDPMYAVTCWIENNDAKDQEEKDFYPWILPHRWAAGKVSQDEEEETQARRGRSSTDSRWKGHSIP